MRVTSLATQNVGRRGGCRLCTAFEGRPVSVTAVVVVVEQEEEDPYRRFDRLRMMSRGWTMTGSYSTVSSWLDGEDGGIQ
jgi:hypothetical protein